MTYALLIYRALHEPDPAADQRGLVGHRDVQRESKARGELHAVARLDDPPAAKTVRGRGGGAHEVTDGPYIESKEWLVGFYLVDCDGEGEALDRARRLCDERHAVEVRPVTWRTGP
ncbi:MAG: YciI family protein [Polyangiales bacterium]